MLLKIYLATDLCLSLLPDPPQSIVPCSHCHSDSLEAWVKGRGKGSRRQVDTIVLCLCPLDRCRGLSRVCRSRCSYAILNITLSLDALARRLLLASASDWTRWFAGCSTHQTITGRAGSPAAPRINLSLDALVRRLLLTSAFDWTRWFAGSSTHSSIAGRAGLYAGFPAYRHI